MSILSTGHNWILYFGEKVSVRKTQCFEFNNTLILVFTYLPSLICSDILSLSSPSSALLLILAV